MKKISIHIYCTHIKKLTFNKIYIKIMSIQFTSITDPSTGLPPRQPLRLVAQPLAPSPLPLPPSLPTVRQSTTVIQ